MRLVDQKLRNYVYTFLGLIVILQSVHKHHLEDSSSLD